jgi:hypothetical protein
MSARFRRVVSPVVFVGSAAAIISLDSTLGRKLLISSTSIF